MTFDAGTWWLISILLTALITIIGVLVGRTVFGKLDENSKDIKQVRECYIPRKEHADAIAAVREDFKSELKALRIELREENRKLTEDVEDIRENCMRKDDFYRCHADTNKKLDKTYELILKGNGGVQRGSITNA